MVTVNDRTGSVVIGDGSGFIYWMQRKGKAMWYVSIGVEACGMRVREGSYNAVVDDYGNLVRV